MDPGFRLKVKTRIEIIPDRWHRDIIFQRGVETTGPVCPYLLATGSDGLIEPDPEFPSFLWWVQVFLRAFFVFYFRYGIGLGQEQRRPRCYCSHRNAKGPDLSGLRTLKRPACRRRFPCPWGIGIGEARMKTGLHGMGIGLRRMKTGLTGIPVHIQVRHRRPVLFTGRSSAPLPCICSPPHSPAGSRIDSDGSGPATGRGGIMVSNGRFDRRSRSDRGGFTRNNSSGSSRFTRHSRPGSGRRCSRRLSSSPPGRSGRWTGRRSRRPGVPHSGRCGRTGRMPGV